MGTTADAGGFFRALFSHMKIRFLFRTFCPTGRRTYVRLVFFLHMRFLFATEILSRSPSVFSRSFRPAQDEPERRSKTFLLNSCKASIRFFDKEFSGFFLSTTNSSEFATNLGFLQATESFEAFCRNAESSVSLHVPLVSVLDCVHPKPFRFVPRPQFRRKGFSGIPLSTTNFPRPRVRSKTFANDSLGDGDRFPSAFRSGRL